MLLVATFTEKGSRHRENEDAFVVSAHPHNADVIMCFLADGMGGQSFGGPAARLACERAYEVACTYSPADLANPNSWNNVFREVDATVDRESKAGFTTFIGLVVIPEKIVGVSCGDSAAFHLSSNGFRELTNKQHKHPPLGSGAAIPVTFQANWQAPMKVLIVTDGVWKYVSRDAIVESLELDSSTAMIQQLRSSAALPSNGELADDFTMILLEGS